MKRWSMICALVLLAVLVASSAAAEDCSTTCEWGYGPENGPHRWADLCCPVCDGENQSPIDIVTQRARKEPADSDTGVALNYGTTHLELANDGRSIRATDELSQGENTIEIGGRIYPLTEFHFHSLSEHTLDGRHAPLEMHLEHARTSYDVVTLAVLIEEGEENEAFAPIWNSLPVDATVEPRTVIVNPRKLMPKNRRGYYLYQGSESSPSCAEIVTWYVFDEAVEMSVEQIEAFRAIHESNYRPVRPQGTRVVYKSMVTEGS